MLKGKLSTWVVGLLALSFFASTHLPAKHEFLVIRLFLTILFVFVLPGLFITQILNPGWSYRSQSFLYIFGVGIVTTVIIVWLWNFSASTSLVNSPITAKKIAILLSGVSVLLSTHQNCSLSFLNKKWSFQRYKFLTLSLVFPTVSIAGSIVLNKGQSPILIILLYSILLASPFLSYYIIEPHSRPFFYFCVSLSILYSTSLITTHVWGWDIHFQLFTTNNVIDKGIWNPDLRTTSNSLLTIVLLTAILSELTGIVSPYVIKIMNPALFSLVPVGIYFVAKEEFENPKVKIFAPFPFMFWFGFIKKIPDKQLISELFLMLLVLSIIDKGLSDTSRKVFMLIFGIGAILSHYAGSLMILIVLTLSVFLAAFFRKARCQNIKRVKTRVPVYFLILSSVLWVSWYMEVSKGLNFERVAHRAFVIMTRFILGIEGTPIRSGAGYATRETETIYWILYKFFHALLVFFIFLGAVCAAISLWKKKGKSRTIEYHTASISALALLLPSVLFPFGLGFDRILNFSLVFVSPHVILGVFYVGRLLGEKAVDYQSMKKLVVKGSTVMIICLYLSGLFLFSSGLIFHLGGQQVPPYSIGLNPDAGWPVYNQQHVSGGSWVSKHIEYNTRIAVYNPWPSEGTRDAVLISEFIHRKNVIGISERRATPPQQKYVFATNRPMFKRESRREYISTFNNIFYEKVLSKSNRVYDNGKSWLFYTGT